jgi:hypothetical protein
MRKIFLITLLAALAATTLAARLAQDPADTTSRGPTPPSPASSDPREGSLAKLHAFDDFSATLGFPSGASGYIVEENEVRNRTSHLAFERWVKGALVVGIQGGSVGVVKDIGDVRLRRTECSVLPFLTQREGTVFDTSLEKSGIPEAGIALHDEASSCAAAEVHVGHIYLIRIDDPERFLFAAVRVVEHVPGQSVTLRWRML